MTDQHQGHTIDDVTDRIEQLPGGLLAFDEDPGDAPSQDEAAPEGKKNSPSEQEQPDEAEEPEKEEKTDKDDKPEAEDSEDDKDDKSEDETASEEDDPVYEIDLPEGEKVEVPISELAAGYLKSRDVETQKAELAEARREHERRVQELPTLISQRLQEEHGRLSHAIEQWTQANPEIPPPDPEMLNVESPSYDPDAYYRQKEQRELRNAKAQQAAQQLQVIAQQREQQQAAYEAQEREKLKAAWPELVTDSAAQKELYRDAEQYFGLTPDDIGGIQNHKAFLVLRDAIGYRKMRDKAPAVREKVKAKPKPVRAGPRKTPSDQKRADTEEQRKRLRKTGRPEDAMAVFERLNL